MNLPQLQSATSKRIEISGLPESVTEIEAAVFRSRLDRLVREFVADQQLSYLDAKVRYGPPPAAAERSLYGSGKAAEREKREHISPEYVAREPLFAKEFLVVSNQVRERLESAMQLIGLQSLLFDTWGLSQIEPFPRSALNFHGPPGTGKTLAAHVVAAATNRRIICASYANIESMYHGEGPKNVAELFRSAEAADAVLFIDEADSLLSKRLVNVTQGSEQAINSMRSQLLICLDNLKGVVVFATNLVSNYDPAFDTRVEHIYFPAPDKETRLLLWEKHLPAKLPLGDVSLDALADASHGLVGREIKNAVIGAAIAAARARQDCLSQENFIVAIETIKSARQQREPVKG